MSTEVLRVDPTSTLQVGVPWSGFGLAEQRFPVSGDGYQLWDLTRAGVTRNSRVLDGMPLTAPFRTAAGLAKALADDPALAGDITFDDALVFVRDVEFYDGASLVGVRWLLGAAGAVAKHRYQQGGA